MAGKAILVCGEDAFLADRKTHEVMDALVPAADRALGLEVVDGQLSSGEEVASAVGQAMEAVRTVGFLGTGKLVWLKRPDAVFDAATKLSAALRQSAEGLKKLLDGEGIPDGHTLLVSVGAVGRQTALYKSFAKHAEVFDFAVGSKPNEMRRHASEQLTGLLKHYGLRMDMRVRDVFLSRVGTESWRLAGEVEKLDLFLEERREVLDADVVNVTSLGDVDSAWDLTDAIGERDMSKTITALRRLLGQRTAPIALASMIEGRIRDLLVLRESMDRGWVRFPPASDRYAKPDWSALPESIFADESSRFDPRRMHPYRALQLSRQAACYSIRELRNARHLMLTLRERLVSTGVPGEVMLEITLLRIVQRRAPLRTSTTAKGR